MVEIRQISQIQKQEDSYGHYQSGNTERKFHIGRPVVGSDRTR